MVEEGGKGEHVAADEAGDYFEDAKVGEGGLG